MGLQNLMRFMHMQRQRDQQRRRQDPPSEPPPRLSLILMDRGVVSPLHLIPRYSISAHAKAKDLVLAASFFFGPPTILRFLSLEYAAPKNLY